MTLRDTGEDSRPFQTEAVIRLLRWPSLENATHQTPHTAATAVFRLRTFLPRRTVNATGGRTSDVTNIPPPDLKI
jgi:hypothetical protein